jgi:hypothetical protein
MDKETSLKRAVPFGIAPSTPSAGIPKALHSFVAYGFGNPGNLVVNMASFNIMSYGESIELLTYGASLRVGPVAKYL